MSLSKISIAHCEAMAALHAVSFDEPWTEYAFYKLVKLPTTIGWIDENGFILCSHILDEMEIMTLCTHPNQRRQGYGQLLLNQLFEYATTHQVKNIFLEVRADNIPAQKLYEKMRFHTIGIRKGYYHTHTSQIDAVCMKKDI